MLAIKGADVLGQANAPLLQSPLDAGLSTQQVAGVSEGNPTPIEQLEDVRGELQAVVPIQVLGVITLTSGLDVAGNQQSLVAHTGDVHLGLIASNGR
ncbi:hypothetical protein [Aeromonas hydrophila]